jgi:hypothetical protein
MTRILFFALVLAAPGLARAADIVFPTDICVKFPCRDLTAQEQAKMGRVMAKLMASLPIPEADRYQQTGLKSQQGLGAVMVTTDMWQAADFPSNVVDTSALSFGKAGAFPRSFTLTYSFTLKDDGERSKLELGPSFHKLANGDVENFDVRIEVSAWAIPAVYDANSFPIAKGSDTHEKKLWGDERNTARMTVIVGAHAPKKEAPSSVPPGETLAPVKAIKVDFQGPTAEVKALAKKLNRASFKALLGPIDKIISGN